MLNFKPNSYVYNSARHSKLQYNMCVMWLKPFGHQKTRKKRPSFSALGKNQAAMGQVSDNAAMGHVSKEMQPVALRSIKKVVRTEFADHFMFVPIGPIGCV
jgi:hypothetical protein